MRPSWGLLYLFFSLLFSSPLSLTQNINTSFLWSSGLQGALMPMLRTPLFSTVRSGWTLPRWHLYIYLQSTIHTHTHSTQNNGSPNKKKKPCWTSFLNICCLQFDKNMYNLKYFSHMVVYLCTIFFCFVLFCTLWVYSSRLILSMSVYKWALKGSQEIPF